MKTLFPRLFVTELVREYMREKFAPEIGPGGEEERGELGEAKKFSIWKEPLNKKEVEDFFSFIKQIRKQESRKEKEEWLKKLLPHLLGRRLEKELGEEGKRIVEVEDKSGKEIFKQEGYQWIPEKDGEKEKLKIWRDVIMGADRKWVPERVIIEGEKLKMTIENFLKEIEEIKEEELEQIEKKRSEKNRKN